MTSNMITTLRDSKRETTERAKSILKRAEAEGRDLTPSEDRDYKLALEDVRSINSRLDRLIDEEREAHRIEGVLSELGLSGNSNTADVRAGDWVDPNSGQRVSLRKGETFRSWSANRPNPGDAVAEAQYSGVGSMLRAMSTTSVSAIVPTTWAANIIDRARNVSQVMSSGATLVPMDSKVLEVGRLTGDPTTAFRTEGSTITPSDVVLDNVTRTAKTQSVLLVGSLEWFQDADNADNIVADAIAQAIALQLDLTALYGGITSGSGTINLPAPNPVGVLAGLTAQLPANVLGNATNGTAQTSTSYYNELLDTIFQARAGNEEPNAIIWNSKAARQYAGAYDTTGQPLQMPTDLAQIDRRVSNQIPSFTKGTMTNRATDVFVGDWSKLLIGQRLGLTIQPLTERYAENGQIGVVAHWRGDVAIARPSAFSVYRAIQGGA